MNKEKLVSYIMGICTLIIIMCIIILGCIYIDINLIPELLK